MVRMRLLFVLVGLLLAGCGAIRQEIFALTEQSSGDATLDAGETFDAGPLGDASMDAEVLDAALDADTGMVGDADASGVHDGATPRGCPKGPYLGEFMCDFGANSLFVVGEVSFSIGDMNPITRKANLIDGRARGIVPVSSDDLTPFAELAPVMISGEVTCIPGASPQLDVQSAETSFIGLVDVLPPPVVLAITASSEDHEEFVGRFAVSGGVAAWECSGTFTAAPGEPDPPGPFLPGP